MRKTEIRTTQKRDVIYIISSEEYLNRWRDKEDQLQMYFTGTRFWLSHQSPPNKLGWNSQQLFLFSKVVVLKTVSEINPSER